MSEDVYTIPVPEDVYTIPEPTNDTYEYLRFGNPWNTTQRGESSESKKNCHKATTVCLGLLCLLLSVGIIGLVIHNSELNKELTEERDDLSRKLCDSKLIKEKNDLVKDRDQIQSRYNNLTELNDQIQSKNSNLTEERDDLKRRLCETHGFTFGGGVCYYVSTEKKTWNASLQYCRDRHSDLMVINGKEKQDFVERVTGRNQKMWLGLTDRQIEGVWKWVDGTPLTTPTYWRSGEPNNKESSSNAEEDCAEFVGLNGGRGWNDRACSSMNNWICEMF